MIWDTLWLVGYLIESVVVALALVCAVLFVGLGAVVTYVDARERYRARNDPAGLKALGELLRDREHRAGRQ